MPESVIISFTFQEYGNLKELTDNDRELVLTARQAAENAYAPYSRIRVGAAIRLASGRIINGSNVEMLLSLQVSAPREMFSKH